MRIPRTPPRLFEILQRISNEGTNAEKLIALVSSTAGPTQNGKYLHWNKLRYYTPPNGMNHEEWWYVVKQARRAVSTPLPLSSADGSEFQFALCDPIPKELHHIDLQAGGKIEAPTEIINPETRDSYYVSSLIEEAITSSQLEGANTTRRVAKEMIRRNRPPKDKSERMILNNYMTMKRIGDLKNEPLTPELIFELHRLVTSDTLDDPSAAGRLRNSNENICVCDEYGTVLHTPPPADSLERRIKVLCKFANDMTPDPFVHPTIKAISLHFGLAYDHPFADGNGRTARALFYWAMLHYGYWLFEFVSISHIILKAPAKYGLAFLHTETDDNDVTYFIIHQLDVIRRAIEELHSYIQRKSKELRVLAAELQGVEVLNHRQRALITHALRHPHTTYTIQSHKASHNVVYQTARADLLNLVERKFLVQSKSGKTLQFRASENLEKTLRDY